MAKQCGAKKRNGEPCPTRPMPNGRCRMHGGASTGPKDTTNSSRNSLKHGIYATRFSDDEVALSQELKLGTVDEELRLMRLRLRRALEAEHQAAGEPELEEVVERDISSEIGAREEKKSKVRDYVGIVDKILARIESLERTRLILRAEIPPDPEDMNAERLTAGKPDEPTPATPIR